MLDACTSGDLDHLIVIGFGPDGKSIFSVWVISFQTVTLF